MIPFRLNPLGTIMNPEEYTPGMILHYDGINNTGSGHNPNAGEWEDLSLNGYTGIISGAVGFKENGAFFPAIGSYDRMTAQLTEGLLVGASNATIELAFIPSSTARGYIVAKSHDTRGTFMISTTDYMFDGTNNLSLLTLYSVTPKINTLNIISIVFDSGVARYYLNGILIQTDTGFSEKLGESTSKLVIGAYTYGAGQVNYAPFSGIVCSVRIYDKSLSAADVQRNYLIDASRFGS